MTAKRIEIMKSRGTTLGEYVNGEIYRGVLTGFNKRLLSTGRSELSLLRPTHVAARLSSRSSSVTT